MERRDIIELVGVGAPLAIGLMWLGSLETRVKQLEARPSVGATAVDPRKAECAELARQAASSGPEQSAKSQDEVSNIMASLGCHGG